MPRSGSVADGGGVAVFAAAPSYAQCPAPPAVPSASPPAELPAASLRRLQAIRSARSHLPFRPLPHPPRCPLPRFVDSRL
eukprot:tig00000157_g9650.t1